MFLHKASSFLSRVSGLETQFWLAARPHKARRSSLLVGLFAVACRSEAITRGREATYLLKAHTHNFYLVYRFISYVFNAVTPRSGFFYRQYKDYWLVFWLCNLSSMAVLFHSALEWGGNHSNAGRPAYFHRILLTFPNTSSSPCSENEKEMLTSFNRSSLPRSTLAEIMIMATLGVLWNSEKVFVSSWGGTAKLL